MQRTKRAAHFHELFLGYCPPHNVSGVVFELCEVAEELYGMGCTEDEVCNHPCIVIYVNSLDYTTGACDGSMLPLEPPMKTVQELFAKLRFTMQALCDDPKVSQQQRNTHLEVQKCIWQLLYYCRARGTDNEPRIVKAHEAAERIKQTGVNEFLMLTPC